VNIRLISGLAIIGFCLALPTAWSVDEDAAEALARKSGCLKCHGLSRKKDGPSLKEIAAKYKGKSDAEQKITAHVTTPSKVKIEGKEEDHGQLKTENTAEIRNVVQWVLSR
jgi:cytochrome c